MLAYGLNQASSTIIASYNTLQLSTTAILATISTTELTVYLQDEDTYCLGNCWKIAISIIVFDKTAHYKTYMEFGDHEHVHLK